MSSKESMWADKGGGEGFKPAPAGSHIARCYMVVDVGTHHNPMFDNYRHQWMVGFELPNEPPRKWKDKDGVEQERTETVGKFYTASLSEKANLRKDLESWRGRPFTEDELKGFAPRNILGKPCMLNVVHKTKQNGELKAEIAAIMPLTRGMTCPPAIMGEIFYDLAAHEDILFNLLPKGLREMIRRSEEWKKIAENQNVAAAHGEDEPFVDDDLSDVPF